MPLGVWGGTTPFSQEFPSGGVRSENRIVGEGESLTSLALKWAERTKRESQLGHVCSVPPVVYRPQLMQCVPHYHVVIRTSELGSFCRPPPQDAGRPHPGGF